MTLERYQSTASVSLRVNGHRADERSQLDSSFSPGADQRIDYAAAQRAARDLLVALGADLSAEGLREAPRRMAGDVAELLTPQLFKLTMFANEERYDELAVTRSIPFQSLCMHHRLSFFGVVHIAPALHGIVRDDPRTRQESLSLTQRSTP